MNPVRFDAASKLGLFENNFPRFRFWNRRSFAQKLAGHLPAQNPIDIYFD
jgi:hypothetical protein